MGIAFALNKKIAMDHQMKPKILQRMKIVDVVKVETRKLIKK